MIRHGILFIFALTVAFFRFMRMGDLTPGAKWFQSIALFAAAYVCGLVFFWILGNFASSSGGASRPSWSGRSQGKPLTDEDVRAVKREELTSHESEMPEVDRPQVEGIQGKPPAELAEMLRNMTEGGE